MNMPWKPRPERPKRPRRSNMKVYILKGHQVWATQDIELWGRMFNNDKTRIVAKTETKTHEVSTVFLGLDHSHQLNPKRAIVFETMIFGGPADHYQTRCATWAEATIMHTPAEQAADLMLRKRPSPIWWKALQDLEWRSRR